MKPSPSLWNRIQILFIVSETSLMQKRRPQEIAEGHTKDVWNSATFLCEKTQTRRGFIYIILRSRDSSKKVPLDLESRDYGLAFFYQGVNGSSRKNFLGIFFATHLLTWSPTAARRLVALVLPSVAAKPLQLSGWRVGFSHSCPGFESCHCVFFFLLFIIALLPGHTEVYYRG